ncbi:hypothetical protein [Variovorax sp. PMC12]|uniref:hypothetical protein n=1 Tax=Variovorax sp. PMC12 TaxID=2126319 RepID=UPI00131BD3A0|nr:hypothetical protein [Variovorax sp. PMC12]
MTTKTKVANVQATAEIQLTLRIKVNGSWGGDCPAEQIFRQARAEAVSMINNALYESRDHLRNRIAIVGTPEILTVIGVRK